ncbi:MAG: efflux RND transporter periplasmic adaptor subunit [Patescibacteria group bacterium]|nr:efflux RND transporter periplasmic adaptor subunit [Patescibacteria group bacterium]
MNLLIKKKFIILALILLFAGGCLYFLFRPKTPPEDRAYTLRRQTLATTVSFSGEINAEEKAVLAFPTSGKLSWVGVKRGDTVSAGQLIASLDQTQLRKQLQRALNVYDKTRRNFDQVRDDTSVRKVTDADTIDDQFKRILESAQYDLNNSVIDVELQQLTIDYANLFTPIQGIVTRVDAPNAGVNITPQSAVFEVINPATVYFSALIDQTEIANITESMTGEIVLDAFPELPLRGTVQSISFTPQPGETGTVYEAKLLLLSPDLSRFRLGMTGDVTFTLDQKKDVLSVPLRYILTEDEKDFVLKKAGNGTKKTQIETGDEINGNVVVTSGLAEGDIIYEFPD